MSFLINRKKVELQSWADVYALYDHGTVFYQLFHGIEPVQGYLCLIAYYTESIKGYLPPSELGLDEPTEDDLVELLKRPIPVRISSIVRQNGVVVLSRRLAVDYLSSRFWEKVEPEQIIEGYIISPVYPGGEVVMEVDGIRVIVPPEEVTWLSWISTQDLRLRYPQYSSIKAKVLGVDRDTKTVTASIRALESDPWERDTYCRGLIFAGVITGSNKSNGVFVRFPDGLTCLCDVKIKHIAGQMALTHGKEMILPLGSLVQVKINKVDKVKRKLAGTIINAVTNVEASF